MFRRNFGRPARDSATSSSTNRFNSLHRADETGKSFGYRGQTARRDWLPKRKKSRSRAITPALRKTNSRSLFFITRPDRLDLALRQNTDERRILTQPIPFFIGACDDAKH